MKSLKHSVNFRVDVPYEDGYRFKFGDHTYTITGSTPVLFLQSLFNIRSQILRDTGASVMFKVSLTGTDYFLSTFFQPQRLEKVHVDGTILQTDDRVEYESFSGVPYYTTRIYNVVKASLSGTPHWFGSIFIDRTVYLVYKAHIDDDMWHLRDANNFFHLVTQFEEINQVQESVRNDTPEFVTIAYLDGITLRSLPLEDISDELQQRWGLQLKSYVYIPMPNYLTFEDEIRGYVNTINEMYETGYKIVASLELHTKLYDELRSEDVETNEQVLREKLRYKFEQRQRARNRREQLFSSYGGSLVENAQPINNYWHTARQAYRWGYDRAMTPQPAEPRDVEPVRPIVDDVDGQAEFEGFDDIVNTGYTTWHMERLEEGLRTIEQRMRERLTGRNENLGEDDDED